jgi:integrase
VPVPEVILPELRHHLALYAQHGLDGRVFLGAKGATPRRNHFGKVWRRACAAVEVPGLHFHDLRHTGNTLAATSGASTKELMTRFGHSTTRAAMIYQHATDPRQKAIAAAINAQILDGLKRGSGRLAGTAPDAPPETKI